MRILYAFVLLICCFAVQAELTYPIDIDEWNERTAYLDTSTGEITDRGRSWPATDPDTYVCPVCGIDPGFPPNIAPLRQLDANPIPSYDSRLYSVSQAEIICGPEISTLPTECNGTPDVIVRLWTTVERAQTEQELAVDNEAAFQVLENISEAKFRLHVLAQIALNMMRLDSQQLPPKWQTVNDAHWNFMVNKVLPIWDRRKELQDSVDAGTITGGEMDTSWPVPEPGALPE